MKRFRVEIIGDNLLFNLDGDHRLFSLEATCFVVAPDAQLAGKTALARLLLAPALKERLVDAGQRRASYILQEVRELSRFAYFRGKRAEKLEFRPMEGEPA